MMLHNSPIKEILLFLCVSFSICGALGENYDYEVVAVQSGMAPGSPAVIKFEDVEANMFYIQYGVNNSLIFFGTIPAQVDVERYSNTFENGTSTIVIDPVVLSDAGVYRCMQNGDLSGSKTKRTNLVVNKIPDYSSEIVTNVVKSGDAASVASCSALNSKPASTITFEDENGVVVESLEEEIVLTDSNTSLSNTTKSLTLNWDTSLAGKSYYCVINHASVPEPMKRELVSDINVLYEPTIEISVENTTLPAGSYFSASCQTDGNPKPELSWTFTSDGGDSLNPDNFVTELNGDGKLILSAESLVTSNNGTWVCRAEESEHYPAVETSLSLSVYELPTTTPVTTTTSTNTEVQTSPSTGGMNPVLIAVLVAAICFVCIVALIALLRHFVTHKGEYYTNESKQTESMQGEAQVDSDDETLDGELLQSRKPEHFV